MAAEYVPEQDPPAGNSEEAVPLSVPPAVLDDTDPAMKSVSEKRNLFKSREGISSTLSSGTGFSSNSKAPPQSPNPRPSNAEPPEAITRAGSADSANPASPDDPAMMSVLEKRSMFGSRVNSFGSAVPAPAGKATEHLMGALPQPNFVLPKPAPADDASDDSADSEEEDEGHPSSRAAASVQPPAAEAVDAGPIEWKPKASGPPKAAPASAPQGEVAVTGRACEQAKAQLPANGDLGENLETLVEKQNYEISLLKFQLTEAKGRIKSLDKLLLESEQRNKALQLQLDKVEADRERPGKGRAAVEGEAKLEALLKEKEGELERLREEKAGAVLKVEGERKVKEETEAKLREAEDERAKLAKELDTIRTEFQKALATEKKEKQAVEEVLEALKGEVVSLRTEKDKAQGASEAEDSTRAELRRALETVEEQLRAARGAESPPSSPPSATVSFEDLMGKLEGHVRWVVLKKARLETEVATEKEERAFVEKRQEQLGTELANLVTERDTFKEEAAKQKNLKEESYVRLQTAKVELKSLRQQREEAIEQQNAAEERLAQLEQLLAETNAQVQGHVRETESLVGEKRQAEEELERERKARRDAEAQRESASKKLEEEQKARWEVEAQRESLQKQVEKEKKELADLAAKKEAVSKELQRLREEYGRENGKLVNELGEVRRRGMGAEERVKRLEGALEEVRKDKQQQVEAAKADRTAKLKVEMELEGVRRELTALKESATKRQGEGAHELDRLRAALAQAEAQREHLKQELAVLRTEKQELEKVVETERSSKEEVEHESQKAAKQMLALKEEVGKYKKLLAEERAAKAKVEKEIVHVNKVSGVVEMEKERKEKELEDDKKKRRAVEVKYEAAVKEAHNLRDEVAALNKQLEAQRRAGSDMEKRLERAEREVKWAKEDKARFEGDSPRHSDSITRELKGLREASSRMAREAELERRGRAEAEERAAKALGEAEALKEGIARKEEEVEREKEERKAAELRVARELEGLQKFKEKQEEAEREMEAARKARRDAEGKAVMAQKEMEALLEEKMKLEMQLGEEVEARQEAEAKLGAGDGAGATVQVTREVSNTIEQRGRQGSDGTAKLIQELAALKAELAAAKEENARLASAAADAGQEDKQEAPVGIDSVQLASMAAELEAAKEDNARLSALTEQLELTTYSQAEFDELSADLASAKEANARLSDELEEAKRDKALLSQLAAELEEAKRDNSRLMALAQEVEASRETIARLGELADALDAAQQEHARLEGLAVELQAAKEENSKLRAMSEEVEELRKDRARLIGMTAEVQIARNDRAKVSALTAELVAAAEEKARLEATIAELQRGSKEAARVAVLADELAATKQHLVKLEDEKTKKSEDMEAEVYILETENARLEEATSRLERNWEVEKQLREEADELAKILATELDGVRAERDRLLAESTSSSRETETGLLQGAAALADKGEPSLLGNDGDDHSHGAPRGLRRIRAPSGAGEKEDMVLLTEYEGIVGADEEGWLTDGEDRHGARLEPPATVGLAGTLSDPMAEERSPVLMAHRRASAGGGGNTMVKQLLSLGPSGSARKPSQQCTAAPPSRGGRGVSQVSSLRGQTPSKPLGVPGANCSTRLAASSTASRGQSKSGMVPNKTAEARPVVLRNPYAYGAQGLRGSGNPSASASARVPLRPLDRTARAPSTQSSSSAKLTPALRTASNSSFKGQGNSSGTGTGALKLTPSLRTGSAGPSLSLGSPCLRAGSTPSPGARVRPASPSAAAARPASPTAASARPASPTATTPMPRLGSGPRAGSTPSPMSSAAMGLRASLSRVSMDRAPTPPSARATSQPLYAARKK